eukprot:m51a1_g1146 hypothetical protein (249) ;mRNA; f:278513-279552
MATLSESRSEVPLEVVSSSSKSSLLGNSEERASPMPLLRRAHDVESHHEAQPGLRVLADPGPLGLAAFGTTTMLLNLHNSKALSAGSSMPMILAMGAFYGGFVQLVAGVLEYVRGNTFACVAFTSYGAFWETFVFARFFIIWGLAEPLDEASASAYLFVWGLFSLGMTCAAVKNRLSRCMQVLFALVWLLFWLLALGDILKFHGHHKAGSVVGQIAGIEGIVCGGLALYMSAAELNGWPLFPMPKKRE